MAGPGRAGGGGSGERRGRRPARRWGRAAADAVVRVPVARGSATRHENDGSAARRENDRHQPLPGPRRGATFTVAHFQGCMVFGHGSVQKSDRAVSVSTAVARARCVARRGDPPPGNRRSRTRQPAARPAQVPGLEAVMRLRCRALASRSVSSPPDCRTRDGLSPRARSRLLRHFRGLELGSTAAERAVRGWDSVGAGLAQCVTMVTRGAGHRHTRASHLRQVGTAGRTWPRKIVFALHSSLTASAPCRGASCPENTWSSGCAVTTTS